VLYMTGGSPLMRARNESLPDEIRLLAKPFSRLQLVDKVQEVLRGSERSSNAGKR